MFGCSTFVTLMTSRLIGKTMSLVLSLLCLAGCSSFAPPPHPDILTDMGQLKQRFNQAKGKTRLVLLISPT
jgi:hypothetical protein